MADNLYEVELRNGQSHTVRTPHHHDDHPPKKFEDHLLDVLKGTLGGAAGGVIAQGITRIVYKGKAPPPHR